MIAGNPDTSTLVRWELVAAFYALVVIAVVCWSIYETTLKRRGARRGRARGRRR